MSEKTNPPSNDFEMAFSDHGGGCVRICHCGRTLFNSDGDWDWEKGELEELQKKADEDPDHFIDLPYTVSTCTINSSEYVMGCPCNGMRAYEDFIINHATQIAKYLNKRVEALERKAKEIFCKGIPPVIAEGWRSMETAPQNAKSVQLLTQQGHKCIGHFAQDLSDEDQPAFSGWFKEVRTPLDEIKHVEPVIPVAWKPL